MNFLFKGFCRVYQTLFHMALPFLPYRLPKLLHSVEELPAELSRAGINSVLLVTDSYLHQSGITSSLEKALDKSNIKYVLYNKTRPNPTVENAEQARELFL